MKECSSIFDHKTNHQKSVPVYFEENILNADIPGLKLSKDENQIDFLALAIARFVHKLTRNFSSSPSFRLQGSTRMNNRDK